MSNHMKYVRDKEKYELEHGPGTFDEHIANLPPAEVSYIHAYIHTYIHTYMIALFATIN